MQFQFLYQYKNFNYCALIYDTAQALFIFNYTSVSVFFFFIGYQVH